MDIGYDIELITTSLDYAELNMVKYEAIEKIIIFEIALKLETTNKHLSFVQNLEKSLNLYYKLNNITPEIMYITEKDKKGLGFVRLHRDINTVDIEELKLFVNLSNYYLGSSLIKDDYPCISILNKKSLKKNILEQVAQTSESGYLVYRHNGRVVVHNR